MLKLHIIVSRYSHINVTTHDAILIYRQAIILLKKTNVIYKNISVFSSYKDIKPLNDCEGNKMNSLLITDFKFSAHGIIANGSGKYISKSIDLQHDRSKCLNAHGRRSTLEPATANFDWCLG